MRMLVTICEHLNDVPEERYLFMRMTYYDHCPEDYEPPFFGPVDANDLGHFHREPVLFNVGLLRTPHHQMRLRCKSVLERLSDTEDETMSIAQEDSCLNNAPTEVQTNSISLNQKQVGAVDELGSCEVETLTLSSTPEKENVSGSVKTDHCLSVKSSSAGDDEILKKIVEFCNGKTRLSLEEVAEALPDTTKNEIQECLDTLLKAGSLIRTYRANSYLIGDLNSPFAHPSLASYIDQHRIKQESEMRYEHSLQGNAHGLFAGSERTDSAIKSQESRCGNRGIPGTAMAAPSPVNSSAMVNSQKAPPLHHPFRTLKLANEASVGCIRKASFVEEPITNTQPKSKKQRMRIGKMRS